MDTEVQLKKAYGYACFSKNTQPISDDLLTDFANAAIPQVATTVVKSFVDTNNKKYARNRPRWNAMLEECEAEGIKMIVIPAISLLSYVTYDAIALVRDIKRKYGIDTYFLMENIYTGAENANEQLQMQALLIEFEEAQKKEKRRLKRIFKELTKE